jgi:hypothetical protein
VDGVGRVRPHTVCACERAGRQPGWEVRGVGVWTVKWVPTWERGVGWGEGLTRAFVPERAGRRGASDGWCGSISKFLWLAPPTHTPG